MKTTATTWLSREEIRELMTPSNLRGFLSLATTWGVIALAFALLLWIPFRPLGWVLALTLLGGRQLGLAILMHECSHGSVFRTRALNEHVALRRARGSAGAAGGGRRRPARARA